MTAVEAYEHTLHGGTIYRRGWYFRGSEMWHESWPSARVPWQWGPEELAATDWRIVREQENGTHLPSQSEAISTLTSSPILSNGYGSIGLRPARDIIKGLAKEYPAMFRKEDEKTS